MISTERLQRILIEETIDPGASHPADTLEARDTRAQFRIEIAAIRRAGGIVDLPPEIEA